MRLVIVARTFFTLFSHIFYPPYLLSMKCAECSTINNFFFCFFFLQYVSITTLSWIEFAMACDFMAQSNGLLKTIYKQKKKISFEVFEMWGTMARLVRWQFLNNLFPREQTQIMNDVNWDSFWLTVTLTHLIAKLIITKIGFFYKLLLGWFCSYSSYSSYSSLSR